MKSVLVALFTTLISLTAYAQSPSMTIACSASVYDQAGDSIWDFNENETENLVIEISKDRIQKVLRIQGPKGFSFDFNLVSSNNEVYFIKGTGIHHKGSGASNEVIAISGPQFSYNLKVKGYSASLDCFTR